MVSNEEKKMKVLNELLEIQRNSATDVYGVGLFNGIELAVSLLEDRDPNYKDVK